MSDVSGPSVMLSCFKIEPFVLIVVSLTFKSDASVSLVPVAQAEQCKQELYYIKQIKAHYQQLFFLFPVYSLMSEVSISQLHTPADKDAVQ